MRFPLSAALAAVTSGVLYGTAPAEAATVSLFGTELSTQVQYQQSGGTQRAGLTFSDTSTVGPGVEVPDLADLEIASNPFNLFVVPVSVDAGSDYIQLDYAKAGSGAFAGGAFNGYRFTFDSTVPVNILSAKVNPITTLAGFDESRLAFDGSNLFANVASLGYRSSSILRIDLAAETAGEPGVPVPPHAPPAVPIPLPATAWVMLLGLAGLGTLRLRCG